MNLRMIALLAGMRVRLVFCDRSSLIWLFAMPLFFSFVMGQMMGGTWTSDTLPSFRVYDLDGEHWADTLAERLSGNDYFRVVRIDTIGSIEIAQKAVAKKWSTAAIFLAPGFSDSLDAGAGELQLILYYDSERLSSNAVRTALDRELLNINMRVAARALVTNPDSDADSFDEATFQGHIDDPRVSLNVQTLGRRTEQMELAIRRGTEHIGPAYTLMFVLMFTMLAGKDLVQERLAGTLSRIRLGRASSLDIAFGFVGGGVVVGLIQLTILLVSNSLMFDIDYGPSPVCLALVSVIFVLTSAALALLLGSFCRTAPQADGIGTAATLLMAALGGLWWPLEIVPVFMQQIGLVLPTGIAITIFHDMVGRGYGVAENAALLGRLLVLFAGFMGLATWRFRRLTD